MKRLASQIKRELNLGERKHCAVYERELKRLWPLNQQNREAKIAQFAAEYGLRLRFYRKGLRAILTSVPEVLPCHPSVNAHVYEVRPRKDHRGVDLISDAAIRSSLVGWAKRSQQRS